MKDERTLKEKIRDRWNTIKWKFRMKIKKLTDIIVRNKEVSIAVAVAVGPSLFKAIGKYFGYRKVKKTEEKRERGYYDQRTGEWWYTRKPLNSYEKLELERRYKNGESKGKILMSMGKL